MEFYDGKILANFVWAGKWGRDYWDTTHHPIEQFGKDTWDEKFHLWVTEWDEKEIKIYLDGELDEIRCQPGRPSDQPLSRPAELSA